MKVVFLERNPNYGINKDMNEYLERTYPRVNKVSMENGYFRDDDEIYCRIDTDRFVIKLPVDRIKEIIP